MLQRFSPSESQGFPLSVKLLGEADMPRRCDRAWEACVLGCRSGTGCSSLGLPSSSERNGLAVGGKFLGRNEETEG